MRSRESIPIRRPLNRNRANAYAASAPKKTEKRGDRPEMMIVLTYQLM
jgi:hypothetical protein